MDLVNLRGYLKETGPFVDKFKTVNENEDIDTLSLMVEQLVVENRIEKIPLILKSSNSFSFDRVERVIFSAALKTFFESQSKPLSLNWISWKSARLEGLRALTGLKKSSIYDAMRRGEFPQPVKLSRRAVCWPLSTVQGWIAGRIAQGGGRD